MKKIKSEIAVYETARISYLAAFKSALNSEWTPHSLNSGD
jgi:hypothetical protein